MYKNFYWLLCLFLCNLVVAQDKDSLSVKSNEVEIEHQVDFVIDKKNPDASFSPNSMGGGTLNFGEGKTVRVESVPTSIQDKEGQLFGVDEQGKATYAGEQTPATQNLANNMSTRELRSENGIVRFQAYAGQRYGFDSYIDTYQKAEVYNKKYEDWNGLRVPAKAIASGKPDKVGFTLSNPNLKVEDIYFLTKKGVRYEAGKDEQGNYYVNVIGGNENDGQELFAMLPNKEDTTKPSTIGKLLVVAYPKKERTVVLVPVNSTKVADIKTIEEGLNKIYNPVNIFWKVRQEENFEDKSWDKDKDGKLNVSGSKWYTSYTEEMQALKEAYQQSYSISNTEMYLFLLKQGKTDEENGYVLGDMPRGKQFGFLFMEKMGNEQQLLKTIAHELGHGYFQLKHPFELGLEEQKGKTGLLMDYGYLPVGMQLNKYEWDLMHDPGIVTGLFQSDTSGQYIAQIIQCLSGAALDVILNYTFKWAELLLEEDNPPKFTDFGYVFGKINKGSLITSASISCATAMIPWLPTQKSKIIGVFSTALGSAAVSIVDNIETQYKSISAKYPDKNFVDVLNLIDYAVAIERGGIDAAITGIGTSLIIYAKTNPALQNYASRLQAKIDKQGTQFLEKAGLSKERIEKFCIAVGIKNVNKAIIVPKGWITKASNKGGGLKFVDPKNAHNNIRQMPGNPNSPNPVQQSPYVIFKRNGIPYDVNGNPLKNATDPAAHIPLNQFNINKMPKFD